MEIYVKLDFFFFLLFVNLFGGEFVSFINGSRYLGVYVILKKKKISFMGRKFNIEL